MGSFFAFLEKLLDRIDITLVLVGCMRALMSAVAGFTVGTYSLQLADPFKGAIAIVVGIILIGIGIFISLREIRKAKSRKDDTKSHPINSKPLPREKSTVALPVVAEKDGRQMMAPEFQRDASVVYDSAKVLNPVEGGKATIVDNKKNNMVGGAYVEGEVKVGRDFAGRDVTNIVNIFQSNSIASLGSAPPLPPLVVGREDVICDLKIRLGVISFGERSESLSSLTVVYGLPGIGKSTLAASLAHDSEVIRYYRDGTLWTSLGPTPNLLSELIAWGRAIGIDSISNVESPEEASAQLSAHLITKRRLLIVDDVWDPVHAAFFRVGGHDCATLFTTREPQVAQALAPTAHDVYELGLLTEQASFEMLQKLAPQVVAKYPQTSRELVIELEMLPLALDVAGHLLNAEFASGFFDMDNLLAGIRDGRQFLEQILPSRIGTPGELSLSLAALLQKSTDRLDEQTRNCYSYLGGFAPKPAIFNLEDMKNVWRIDDPKPIVRKLLDRGLLKTIDHQERFYMHALLVMHARSLCSKE